MGCVYSRSSPALITSLCCLNLNIKLSVLVITELWEAFPMARSTSVWFLKKQNSQNRRKHVFFCCCCYCIFLLPLWCFAESLNFCSWLFEMHEELVHKHERNLCNFLVEKLWFIAYYLSAKPFQLLLWKISAHFLVDLKSITQVGRTL